jgi:glycosyltransferase involved in cell wall biosynthesis
MMQEASRKKRILIFVVAYNAESTIQQVVSRIPSSLSEYDVEILIIDDSSRDDTFERAHELGNSGHAPFPLTVLYNSANQGYGGNQKIGFHYAMYNDFDVVALLHGDGQYAPECLPELLHALLEGESDAVLGSRMMTRFAALRGGMPLYKYVGNKILTKIQNRVLRTSFTEFHSGYRLYSVRALRSIPFDRNTNDFHFDTEIIIQLLRAGCRIKEFPIPTYYGDEICHVNGLRYAWDIIKTTLLSRAQDLGIFYERKFDVTAPGDDNNPRYQPKFTFESPHTLTLARVEPGTRVADIGCATGYMSRALSQKGCRVTGIDQFPLKRETAGLERFIQANLDECDFPLDAGAFDYVLLLDVIEHLRSPEAFLESLRRSRTSEGDVKILVSTGNVAFFMTRFALLLGWFNYGLRGILDLTHTRLFTFGTLRRLFEQAGYRIDEVRGVPAPFALALGNGICARVTSTINKYLIRILPGLFAYQIFMICSPLPSLEWLLARAHRARREKIESLQHQN